jgi:VIT1/CCC1 family predicted Fe2+/Mn2+ transporter
MDTNLSEKHIDAFKLFQKNEITEHHIYMRLAKVIKDPNNAAVLERIGKEEKIHYDIWKKYTQIDVKPNFFRVKWFYYLSKIFGITFGIKLMEHGEENAQKAYARYLADIPEAKRIMDEEDAHEHELIGLIDEERLKYVGSIVLGLNDALVELTGALAGFSLALQNTRVIAMAGLISGIAAGFSMAAAGYLSEKAEEGSKNAIKSATYTGVAYFITLFLLIAPYLFLSNYMVCLGLTIGIAILIIFVFNYYISVAKDLNFKHRFLEMTLISLVVSAITFGISFFVKKALGVPDV